MILEGMDDGELREHVLRNRHNGILVALYDFAVQNRAVAAGSGDDGPALGAVCEGTEAADAGA
jgi:hypothetical protein